MPSNSKRAGLSNTSRFNPNLSKAQKAIEDFLDALHLPMRNDPELRLTGARVAKAFVKDLLYGYTMNAADILADTTSANTSGLVVLGPIAVSTLCPHHLMPSVGVAHVGYWPKSKVVGLGALAKLVECCSRRLVLQEQIAEDVALALQNHLGVRAACCVLDLESTCVTARNLKRHRARAKSVAYAGPQATDKRFREDFWHVVSPH